MGKSIEFEVGEDTFTELPNLVFNAYFDDDEDEVQSIPTIPLNRAIGQPPPPPSSKVSNMGGGSIM